MTEVQRLRHDKKKGLPPEKGLAISLSGGGYRAMLFHTGVLIRLNEAGMLQDIKAISSVSGGSITSGVLGMNWDKLEFDDDGVATNFIDIVVKPIQRMASTGIDVRAGLLWLLRIGNLLPLPLHASTVVEAAYRRKLFHDTTLQDLPEDGPRFIFNATNQQSGVRWAFEREAMYDYRVGMVHSPTTPLAKVVAASSAFPPFLAPVVFRPSSIEWQPDDQLADLTDAVYRQRVVLVDGGVYGNLGMEELRYYQSAFVSDAGKRIPSKKRPWSFAPLLLWRAHGVIYSQVRANQARLIVDRAKTKHKDARFDRWARYCFMDTPIDDHRNLKGVLDCPPEATKRLAQTPTRLKRLSTNKQAHLINWGYARCDYVLRVQRDIKVAEPKGFPLPGGVGASRAARSIATPPAGAADSAERTELA